MSSISYLPDASRCCRKNVNALRLQSAVSLLQLSDIISALLGYSAFKFEYFSVSEHIVDGAEYLAICRKEAMPIYKSFRS